MPPSWPWEGVSPGDRIKILRKRVTRLANPRKPMSAPSRRPVDGQKASPRLKKGERRRQLMAHARQLFASLGYPETTIEKVAEAAGVSPSVVTRHFPARLALLQGLVDELRAVTLHRWQEET